MILVIVALLLRWDIGGAIRSADADAARVKIGWATAPCVRRGCVVRGRPRAIRIRRARESKRRRVVGPNHGRTAGRFSYRHRAPSEFTRFMVDTEHQTRSAPSTRETLPDATNVCCDAAANFTTRRGCAAETKFRGMPKRIPKDRSRGSRRLATGARLIADPNQSRQVQRRGDRSSPACDRSRG